MKIEKQEKKKNEIDEVEDELKTVSAKYRKW